MAKKTFAPANTFTPGETNARAVRAPAPASPGKPGARTSDTAPLPNPSDTRAASDTADTEAAADQKGTSKARTRTAGKHRK